MKEEVKFRVLVLAALRILINISWNGLLMRLPRNAITNTVNVPAILLKEIRQFETEAVAFMKASGEIVPETKIADNGKVN